MATEPKTGSNVTSNDVNWHGALLVDGQWRAPPVHPRCTAQPKGGFDARSATATPGRKRGRLRPHPNHSDATASRLSQNISMDVCTDPLGGDGFATSLSSFFRRRLQPVRSAAREPRCKGAEQPQRRTPLPPHANVGGRAGNRACAACSASSHRGANPPRAGTSRSGQDRGPPMLRGRGHCQPFCQRPWMQSWQGCGVREKLAAPWPARLVSAGLVPDRVARGRGGGKDYRV